jgi:membrane carboxypeptidase/penicillin-binding protein PbpC
MTFRSIQSGLSKKITTLDEKAVIQRKVEEVARQVYRTLGASSRDLPVIIYDIEKNSVIIETPSKAIASEFLLRTSEIRSCLQEVGVFPHTITIR